MNIIKEFAKRVSKSARQKRADIFLSIFQIDEETKILDLGSENGLHIKSILERTKALPENIYIADIDLNSITEGNKLFGFYPVPIKEFEPLPFPNRFFDIVYCSSVIEHVTIPKEDVWETKRGREFANKSVINQQKFAEEITRLGKQYFVQTPNKHFLIESHSWLPFIGWLPRRLLVPVLQVLNKIWVKKTSPDWHLLGKNELSVLFKDATIIEEKLFGFSKSIMAVRSITQ